MPASPLTGKYLPPQGTGNPSPNALSVVKHPQDTPAEHAKPPTTGQQHEHQRMGRQKIPSTQGLSRSRIRPHLLALPRTYRPQHHRETTPIRRSRHPPITGRRQQPRKPPPRSSQLQQQQRQQTTTPTNPNHRQPSMVQPKGLTMPNVNLTIVGLEAIHRDEKPPDSLSE